MDARQPDAVAAFGKLEHDANGVPPVQLQQFLRDRLSDLDARDTFSAISRDEVTPEQVASRLGLPSGAITDVEVTRLQHLLSLWRRWAMDDAEGWLITGSSPAGETP